MLRRMLLAIILLSSAGWLPAQTSAPGTFDLAADREPMVVLDGSWRFSPGDDTRWADAAFDDAHWAVLQGNKPWDEQGYAGLSGYAWYRAKLLVPAGAPPLALYIPAFAISTNRQVFANGHLLENCSSDSIGKPVVQTITVCPLGLPQSSAAQTAILAIRVWHWPHWASYAEGGMRGGLRIGGARQIGAWGANREAAVAWQVVTKTELLSILYLLAGFSALGFFLLRPREKEYLWFGMFALLYMVQMSVDKYFALNTHNLETRDLVGGLVSIAADLSLIAFFFKLLGGKRDWLFWTTVTVQAAFLVVMVFGITQSISIALWNELSVLLSLALPIWILSLLIRRAFQGYPDARLLLVPAILGPIVSLIGGALWSLYVVGWYRAQSSWYYDTFHWPFPFLLQDLADFIFLVAMLAILILRFNRTSTQRERLATELEAARIVQQILVPEEIPAIPGFSIHSVYKPAGEVGGDFFQILATTSGGILAIIGDVSGKGMPAAMTVSLLVGTVRTLAHYTQSPAAILTAMNQRMLGRSHGGFTTCLVLRADANGQLTVANAGHLAPYLASQELPLENSLPLGLDAGTIYTESTFQLAAGQQLTLLSDGVVEARNQAGELFGFERTAAISRESAEIVAQAAQAFGQDDDITVLTMLRVAEAAGASA